MCTVAVPGRYTWNQFHGLEGREKLSFEDYFKPSGLDLRAPFV